MLLRIQRIREEISNIGSTELARGKRYVVHHDKLNLRTARALSVIRRSDVLAPLEPALRNLPVFIVNHLKNVALAVFQYRIISGTTIRISNRAYAK